MAIIANLIPPSRADASNKAYVRAGGHRQATISMIPLFGMRLFIPRTPLFINANSQMDINVVYANHGNHMSDASDMSIRFGNCQWKGYQSEKLISGAMPRVQSGIRATSWEY